MNRMADILGRRYRARRELIRRFISDPWASSSTIIIACVVVGGVVDVGGEGLDVHVVSVQEVASSIIPSDLLFGAHVQGIERADDVKNTLDAM